MPEPKAGWTRWYCLRCRRPLANDPSLKPTNPNDSVSPRGDGFTHDTCGGEVALSMREVA